MPSDPSPSSKLPKLPSIGELLKHPTVEQIVQQVNQTTIAQRATGFLEELQSNFHERSEQGVVPSIQQLAERFARRLLGSEQNHAAVVNATGVVLGDHWNDPPLAESAIHELLNATSEYQLHERDLAPQVADRLTELTGAESAWVAHNFASVAAIAATLEDLKVDTQGYFGLTDPADFGLSHVDTIGDRLATEVDLVLIDGAGILGGPSCGIVLGNSQHLDKLLEHPFAEELAADRLTLTALDATLQIYQSDQPPQHHIPVLQLLSAPVANLQQRCERLAPLFEACGAVASATPMQCEAIWYDATATKISGPTWSIKIEPADGSIQALSQQFSQSPTPILGREQQDAFWLDLRSVFPRWDQQLIAAIEG